MIDDDSYDVWSMTDHDDDVRCSCVMMIDDDSHNVWPMMDHDDDVWWWLVTDDDYDAWWWSWLWPRWSLDDTLGAMIWAYIPWSWWLVDFLVDWWSTIFISYSSSSSIFISYSLHQLQLPHPASSSQLPFAIDTKGGEMCMLGGAHPEGELVVSCHQWQRGRSFLPS